MNSIMKSVQLSFDEGVVVHNHFEAAFAAHRTSEIPEDYARFCMMQDNLIAGAANRRNEKDLEKLRFGEYDCVSDIVLI